MITRKLLTKASHESLLTVIVFFLLSILRGPNIFHSTLNFLTSVYLEEDANATWWMMATGLLGILQPPQPEEILQGISND